MIHQFSVMQFGSSKPDHDPAQWPQPNQRGAVADSRAGGSSSSGAYNDDGAALVSSILISFTSMIVTATLTVVLMKLLVSVSGPLLPHATACPEPVLQP
jgi:hypothetical protein